MTELRKVKKATVVSGWEKGKGRSEKMWWRREGKGPLGWEGGKGAPGMGGRERGPWDGGGRERGPRMGGGKGALGWGEGKGP